MIGNERVHPLSDVTPDPVADRRRRTEAMWELERLAYLALLLQLGVITLRQARERGLYGDGGSLERVRA